MKKHIITALMMMLLLPQFALAQPAVTISNPQTSGLECSPSDYSFFQNYRAFWSYVSKKKPSGYPGYWTLVPETWKSGYGGSVCKNVVARGYGQINLKKKTN